MPGAAVDENLYQRIGELTASVRLMHDAVKQQGSAIETLSQETRALMRSSDELRSTFKHINDDLIQLRESVVTVDRMRRAGVDLDAPDDLRRDFAYLRAQREAQDENRPLHKRIRTALIIALLSALIGYYVPHAAARVSAQTQQIEDRP